MTLNDSKTPWLTWWHCPSPWHFHMPQQRPCNVLRPRVLERTVSGSLVPSHEAASHSPLTFNNMISKIGIWPSPSIYLTTSSDHGEVYSVMCMLVTGMKNLIQTPVYLPQWNNYLANPSVLGIWTLDGAWVCETCWHIDTVCNNVWPVWGQNTRQLEWMKKIYRTLNSLQMYA